MIPDNSQLYDTEMNEVSESELQGKYVGVFISASWCGPCRHFGQYLKKYTEKYKENFAVILVGLDKTETAHLNYLKIYNNTFLTLSYEHRPKKQIWGLTSKAYDRKGGGIPLFVLFDEKQEFVSFPWDQIKNDVKGIRSYTPWAYEK
tara:strand:+ start:525 stop:965 length:441 start_codon:yes stop_codon:yes gene_type:complete